MLNELLAVLARDPNATNAVAAAASAISAALAVVMSALALYVSYITLKHQQKHNVLSVRPIPIVTVADFEGSIRVKVRNHGSGPLLIKRVQVRDDTNMKESLVEWMPELPSGLHWANFVGPVFDRSVLPGSEIMLIELNGEFEDLTFRSACGAIRDALAPLTVLVEYTDIYESTFKHYVKDLSWFGRHRVGRYPE